MDSADAYANDAYMRDLHLAVPEDGVASNSVEENRNALDQMRKVLKADTRPSAEISFVRPTPPKP
jgi:isochorismate hydrolase